MANTKKPKTQNGIDSTLSATDSGSETQKLLAMVAKLSAEIEALKNGNVTQTTTSKTPILNGSEQWSPAMWEMFPHVELKDVTSDKPAKIDITKIALTKHTTLKPNYITRTMETVEYVKIHALANIGGKTVTFDVSESSHVGQFIRNAYFDKAGEKYEPNRIYDTPIKFEVTRTATNNTRVPYKFTVKA
jgi:hypothetical protein